MIEIPTGKDRPIRLSRDRLDVIAECQGPPGVTGDEARRMVTAAVFSPGDGPPLAAHVVAGDRVVLAVAGGLPQEDEVVSAVVACLAAAGIPQESITVVRPWHRRLEPLAGGVSTVIFDPTDEASTAYLAADEQGNPIYLPRIMVDADVVVLLGACAWDPALGGQGFEGEIWPLFGRAEAAASFLRSLAVRPKAERRKGRAAVRLVEWQLGVCASLELVGGRGDSLAAASFGLPDLAERAARRAARAGWSPRISRSAELAVVTLRGDAHSWADVVRGLAAASRVTYPDGTICVVSRLDEEPGIVMSRWRQGVPLRPLVQEAVASGDPQLDLDAVCTRQAARWLGGRRLVLLSSLEEQTVESLQFGHAETVDEVERLCRSAESLIILREADRMLPRLG